MKIIGLGKVFESFDLLKFEKNKFFLVTNINFRKDKEEWLKQLVSISKKMIEDDEEISDEFKKVIIDILKIDLFDENLYINISQHSPDEFMFSFKNVEKREVIIYFYNSKCEYDDNTDLDDFDSVTISCEMGDCRITRQSDFIQFETAAYTLKSFSNDQTLINTIYYIKKVKIEEN